jgi:hypothetical protein
MFANYDRLTDYGSAEPAAGRTDHGKPWEKTETLKPTTLGT